MRIGVDGRKIPEAAKRGPIGSLELAHELGLSGLFFRTILEMSRTLDMGELRAVRAKAGELGMYLETGLGKVNPYATPEAPELRVVGGGDIVLGFRRMMEAAAAIECRELWVATANYQPSFDGRFRYDRFRTDVSWEEQLAATERFLHKLAPIARDLGVHMNIETHEEITSFEVVRIVEAVGPDVMGIVFDTANVLQRAEHPVHAARRVAPYVRQTHVKDALLEHAPEGLDFQLRPCGGGVVDFGEILPILAEAKPDLNLTIENAQAETDRSQKHPRMLIGLFDSDWLAGHPDLTVHEYAAYLQLVETYRGRIDLGEILDRSSWLKRSFGFAEAIDFIVESARHLRDVCAAAGIALD